MGEPLETGAKVLSIYNFTMMYSQLLDDIDLHPWSSLEWDCLHEYFQLSSLLKKGTRSSKQQKDRIGLDRETSWGQMLLIKPIAQWELHPQIERHKLFRPQAKRGTTELEGPDGKVKHIKWFRMPSSKEKKLLYKDHLICWTVYTNMNLTREHFGQRDQTLTPIFSITYHLLNNSSKWWQLVPYLKKTDFINFLLKSIEIFPCLQKQLD